MAPSMLQLPREVLVLGTWTLEAEVWGNYKWLAAWMDASGARGEAREASGPCLALASGLAASYASSYWPSWLMLPQASPLLETLPICDVSAAPLQQSSKRRDVSPEHVRGEKPYLVGDSVGGGFRRSFHHRCECNACLCTMRVANPSATLSNWWLLGSQETRAQLDQFLAVHPLSTYQTAWHRAEGVSLGPAVSPSCLYRQKSDRPSAPVHRIRLFPLASEPKGSTALSSTDHDLGRLRWSMAGHGYSLVGRMLCTPRC